MIPPLNQFLIYHNIYVNAVMQGDVVSERWNTKFSVGRTVRLLHIIVFFQGIKVLYSLLRVTNFSIPTPLFTIVAVVMWGQENRSSIGEKEWERSTLVPPKILLLGELCTSTWFSLYTRECTFTWAVEISHESMMWFQFPEFCTGLGFSCFW